MTQHTMYPIPSETLSERKALPTTEEQGNRNESNFRRNSACQGKPPLSHGYAMIHMETEYFSCVRGIGHYNEAKGNYFEDPR